MLVNWVECSVGTASGYAWGLNVPVVMASCPPEHLPSAALRAAEQGPLQIQPSLLFLAHFPPFS